MESTARNEPLASIDESNKQTKTSEEGDTREVDVGTEHVIASNESSRDDATEKEDDHELSSLDREESLMGDIDVREYGVKIRTETCWHKDVKRLEDLTNLLTICGLD